MASGGILFNLSPMKNQTTTPAHHQGISQADYSQGCYGLTLFFLTILIPVILGVSLCALFTPKRK
jgi:hypothetical protein